MNKYIVEFDNGLKMETYFPEKFFNVDKPVGGGVKIDDTYIRIADPNARILDYPKEGVLWYFTNKRLIRIVPK